MADPGSHRSYFEVTSEHTSDKSRPSNKQVQQIQSLQIQLGTVPMLTQTDRKQVKETNPVPENPSIKSFNDEVTDVE
jgi:hypothetical protein